MQDHFKRSPEAASLRRSTSTPSPEAKRRTAAEFLSKAWGYSIPHTSDAEFMRALQDGAALCAAVNLVFPNEVKAVRPGLCTAQGPACHSDAALVLSRLTCTPAQVTRREGSGPSNLNAFVLAVHERLGTAADGLAVGDIMGGRADCAQRLVACVLQLQRLHTSTDVASTSLPFSLQREASDVRPVRDSPAKTLYAAKADRAEPASSSAAAVSVPLSMRGPFGMPASARSASTYAGGSAQQQAELSSMLGKALMERMQGNAGTSVGLLPSNLPPEVTDNFKEVTLQVLNDLTQQYMLLLNQRDIVLQQRDAELTRLRGELAKSLTDTKESCEEMRSVRVSAGSEPGKGGSGQIGVIERLTWSRLRVGAPAPYHPCARSSPNPEGRA
jgi:hypothetical protein